jgi:hypothetical protein
VDVDGGGQGGEDTRRLTGRNAFNQFSETVVKKINYIPLSPSELVIALLKGKASWE